MLEVVISLLLE